MMEPPPTELGRKKAADGAAAAAAGLGGAVEPKIFEDPEKDK